MCTFHYVEWHLKQQPISSMDPALPLFILADMKYSPKNAMHMIIIIRVLGVTYRMKALRN